MKGATKGASPLTKGATKGATSLNKGGMNVGGWNKGAMKGAVKGTLGAGFSPYGKGKGKDKDKGKGKSRPTPAADDPYWEEKKTEENRIEGDGTLYTGTVASYNFTAGWGFVLPDDADSLPEDVKAKLAEASEKAAKRGKTVGDQNLIYFRKPDVAEGYKPEKGAAITFQVYTDDKGAGAYQVSG